MSVLFWILLVVVAIFVFGGAVFAAGWFVLWYVVVGLVIGGLARVLVRGTAGLGMGVTILAGLVGAIAGGWISHALDLAGLLQLLVAVLVSAALIGIATMSSSGSR
jgi:uncharacterized membrane protein YeaQ/YmgE (transglycosylase-associated protein family)